MANPFLSGHTPERPFLDGLPTPNSIFSPSNNSPFPPRQPLRVQQLRGISCSQGSSPSPSLAVSPFTNTLQSISDETSPTDSDSTTSTQNNTSLPTGLPSSCSGTSTPASPYLSIPTLPFLPPLLEPSTLRLSSSSTLPPHLTEFVANKPAVRPADYGALERFSEADAVGREMANRVTLIELRNLLQDVVDMQTHGYKVPESLSSQLYAMARAYLLDPSTGSFKGAHTKLMNVVKSSEFKYIPLVHKENAAVMKIISKDIQKRCTKARNMIKKEVKDSIEGRQHVEDLANHLHRFRLGAQATASISHAEMMRVSILRRFVQADLELESQGKKAVVRPTTMSAKRKRVEHTEEATDEDLSFWDALDQELQDMSKLSHTERFTKISQTYAEDLNQYNAPPEREILDAHRAFNNYFESILPQIIEAGNLARAGRQGY